MTIKMRMTLLLLSGMVGCIDEDKCEVMIDRAREAGYENGYSASSEKTTICQQSLVTAKNNLSSCQARLIDMSMIPR